MTIITDSICLKFITPDVLLAGIGNRIRLIYRDADGKTVDEYLSLQLNCKIYGLCWTQKAVDEYRIIAYGGRELAIVELLLHERRLRILQKLTFGDWISSVLLYENAEASTNEHVLEFCVLSAHSVATRVAANPQGSSWRILNSCKSTEKSTLYCSHLMGKRWCDTVVFGGTALGELIVWTIDEDTLRSVYQRHSGHNGVIFSIDCNLEHNIITTTSDDRSVKIWQTKFSRSNDWQTCQLVPSKSMFGHTARIFQHKIIIHDAKLFIVTIGEDAKVCIWSNDGDLIYRRTQAAEAALWDLDYAAELQTLFVCGSDSNIYQIQLKHILDGCMQQESILPFTECNREEKHDEYMAKIRIIAKGFLIGLTNENRLFYRKPLDLSDWTPIVSEDATTLPTMKCTVLTTFENYIAIAGYQRAHVLSYDNDGQFSTVLAEKLSNGLIRSFTFLSKNEYLVSDDRGNCTITNTETRKSWHFTLPASRERWITTAYKLHNHLLISDRCGNLHLFECNSMADEIHLLHTLKHVHGKLGCTSINGQMVNGQIQFTTAGHDGCLKTIVVVENRLEIGFTKRAPILWIDKVLCDTTNSTTLIAGFNDNHFVLFQTNGSVVFEYECGGGHRYWDLHVDHSNAEGHFYYIRNKVVHRVRFRIDVNGGPFELPLIHWHIRPCNVAIVFPYASDKHLLISGGDDNRLMFHTIDDDARRLMYLNEMTLHVSNIKAVCLFRLSETEVLVFSAGGRAQLCITAMTIDQYGIALRERTNFMLNLTDSTRKRLGKSQTIDFDPETRFMSLLAYQSPSAIGVSPIYLIAACSDGYIRQFEYSNDATHDIKLLQCHFYGRCILNVHRFRWHDHHLLFTMTTDGLVCIWDLNRFDAISTPIFSVSHHDSGINSFDLMCADDHDRVKSATLSIASGGDDQSVVISAIELTMVDEAITISCKKTIRFKDLHTAQVNGVKFIRQRNALFTFGVDQVIYRIGLDNFVAEPIAKSSISDAKGLSILSNHEVIAYGSGIEIINCSSE